MIVFKQKEIDFLQNRALIELKTNCLAKVSELFEAMGKKQFRAFKQLEDFKISPKVSKGEQLKGFPYRLLDYPRNFSSANIFAVRLLFWWGHGITINLHLKGSYLSSFRPSLLPVLRAAKKSKQKIHLSHSGDEWEHSIDAVNYDQINSLQINKIANSSVEFLKICKWYHFDKLNELEGNYQTFFNQFINPIIKANGKIEI